MRTVLPQIVELYEIIADTIHTLTTSREPVLWRGAEWTPAAVERMRAQLGRAALRLDPNALRGLAAEYWRAWCGLPSASVPGGMMPIDCPSSTGNGMLPKSSTTW